MTRKNARVYCISISLGIFFCLPCSTASSLQHPGEGAYISHLQGTAYGRGMSDERFGLLELNMPLQQGDELATAEHSSLAITCAGGAVIWFNADTAGRVESISEAAVIALELGQLFVHNPAAAGADTLVIMPGPSSCNARIEPGSLVKISLGEDGMRGVEAWEGRAQISAEQGTASVEKGKRATVQADGQSLSVTSFAVVVRDDFEKRCLAHYRNHTDTSRKRYVREPLNGTDSLHDYGDWYYDAQVTSYVWRPRVDRSWRPFLYGRWTYHHSGCYWVSSEPWGWAPSHYGVWFKDGLGRWVWVPGYHFSPARVLFFSFGSCYAWAPIGPGFCSFYYAYPSIEDCDYFVYADKDCFYDGCREHDTAKRPPYHRLTHEDIRDSNARDLIAKPIQNIPSPGVLKRFLDAKPDISDTLRERFARHRPGSSPRETAPAKRRSDKRVADRQNLPQRARSPIEKLRQARGSFTVIKTPQRERVLPRAGDVPERSFRSGTRPVRDMLEHAGAEKPVFRSRTRRTFTTNPASSPAPVYSRLRAPAPRKTGSLSGRPVRPVPNAPGISRRVSRGSQPRRATKPFPIVPLPVKSFSVNR